MRGAGTSARRRGDCGGQIHVDAQRGASLWRLQNHVPIKIIVSQACKRVLSGQRRFQLKRIDKSTEIIKKVSIVSTEYILV